MIPGAVAGDRLLERALAVSAGDSSPVDSALSDQSLAPIRDTVVQTVGLLFLLAIAWFALKALARRGGGARRLYDRLDPRVQAGRVWLARSPVTFVYIATWTITSVIVQGAPEELANMFSRFNSTNILGLVTTPLRVLFSSAFIVADNGFAFLGYVLVYVLITARLEQRLGSARLLVVAASAHVLGSLLMVATEAALIQAGLLAKTTIVTVDVGVSYVMVGTCGGYLLFISRKWRWWFYAGMFIAIVLPVLVVRDIWSLGHLNATIIGLLATLVVRRWGTRPPLLWTQLRESLPPRPLATWPQSRYAGDDVAAPAPAGPAPAGPAPAGPAQQPGAGSDLP